jgi:Pyridoxamine 5'-phosphate oxidase
MNTPVTRLDQRYSEEKAVATSWEDTRQVLATAELFWVSTVRADGRPHVTPLVAVWCDDALWFTTGSEEQKYRNLSANPQVVLTTGCNGWEGGLDVVLACEARRVTGAFTSKWRGAWQYVPRDGRFFHGAGSGEGSSEVFAVTPTRVFAHSKGEPFGATTHRF